MPTGAASFDVDSSGMCTCSTRRTLGCSIRPAALRRRPLPGLAGVKADLRVSDASGTAYVLEVANATSPRPLLRSYTLHGGTLRPPR